MALSRKNIFIPLASLAGAFSIYCGGEVAETISDGGGLVGVSDAQEVAPGECCDSAPRLAERTSIATGTIQQDQQSNWVDVSAYANLVLYSFSPTSGCNTSIQYAHVADDPNITGSANGFSPVIGNFARVSVFSSFGGGGCLGTTFRLVGSL